MTDPPYSGYEILVGTDGTVSLNHPGRWRPLDYDDVSDLLSDLREMLIMDIETPK